MGDGVAMTRFAAFLVVVGPVLATTLVYLIRRSRITRAGRYAAYSLLSGYALSFLVPISIVFGGIALGRVAEIAAFAAIVLTIPLLLVLLPGVAIFWSFRCGPTDAARSST